MYDDLDSFIKGVLCGMLLLVVVITAALYITGARCALRHNVSECAQVFVPVE